MPRLLLFASACLFIFLSLSLSPLCQADAAQQVAPFGAFCLLLSSHVRPVFVCICLLLLSLARSFFRSFSFAYVLVFALALTCSQRATLHANDLDSGGALVATANPKRANKCATLSSVARSLQLARHQAFVCARADSLWERDRLAS